MSVLYAIYSLNNGTYRLENTQSTQQNALQFENRIGECEREKRGKLDTIKLFWSTSPTSISRRGCVHALSLSLSLCHRSFFLIIISNHRFKWIRLYLLDLNT